MTCKTLLSILTPLLLLSPANAWLATQYIEVATSVKNGFTYTSSAVLSISTSGVFSTSTELLPGDELTLVNLYISVANLTSTPYQSAPTSISSRVSTVFYAPATITAPPACTGTKFSFVSPVPVSPPPEVLAPPNSLALTSSTSYMTTTYYLNVDGQTTSSSSWSEIDYYLQTGQVLPDLPAETQAALMLCQDPRSCYYGAGACTSPGSGAVTTGVTGANGGATNTAAGKSGSTSTSTSSATGKASAAGRLSPATGEGLWVLLVVSIAGVLGTMLIL